jgi:hypothetical protein
MLSSLIFWLFVVASLVAAYVLLLRPILRARAPSFYTYADGFWVRLSERVRGLRTRLVARFVWLAGSLVAIYDLLLPQIAGVDWAPITAQVPPAVYPFVLLALGLLFSWLRTLTTGPARE